MFGDTPISHPPKHGFPKSVRLLRSSDFRKVYDNGTRHTCPFFAAFCVPGGPGIHIGFTTPRALGKAVVRNRIRRRVREAVRLELGELSAAWSIVFNPRRKTLECTLPELQAEVKRLFIRCSKNSPKPPENALPSSCEATSS
ncbi:MAG: ribonuclease P protein component [Acidobacteriia bacterium]|nr:ribonuclease P protein component [Terriglobia bacterium]